MKKILGLTIAFLLIVSLSVIGAWAYFLDTEVSTGNTLAAGTLDLSWTNESGVPLPFNVSSIAPGETVEARISINNNGTLQLRYAMTTDVVSGTTLANQLQCRLYDYENSIDLYNGSLSGAHIGDQSQGQQAGDRLVDGNSADYLAIEITLPADTGNEYQGLSTNVTFNFIAEQTVNNP